MLSYLKRFFLPSPPADISPEGEAALEADCKACKFPWDQLEHTNYNRVDIWVRHRDNLARAENRKWLRQHAMTFARRWIYLSIYLFGIALAVAYVADNLPAVQAGYLQPVLILGSLFGLVASIIAVVFWLCHWKLSSYIR